jgi:hypothetical protein
MNNIYDECKKLRNMYFNGEISAEELDKRIRELTGDDLDLGETMTMDDLFGGEQ